MIEVINGNALSIPLPDKSVQCVVTSPPYWALRDYGTPGQLGLEPSPTEYAQNIVSVFREVWRVLKDDGTIWVNLGDTYNCNTGAGFNGNKRLDVANRSTVVKSKNGGGMANLRPKNLVGIPWLIAFALQNDGWYLRSDIIWHKPNPMPESVTDRPTKSHEYLFLLSKQERYYYDNEAIKEPGSMASLQHISQPNFDNQTGGDKDYGNGTNPNRSMRKTNENYKKHVSKAYSFSRKTATTPPPGQPCQHREDREDIEYALTRNKRDVWTIATVPYAGAHFATFPPALVEPCILAGSRPGDLVMDPFAGTATVGQVAGLHGRNFVGIELSRDYIGLARHRLSVLPVMLPGML